MGVAAYEIVGSENEWRIQHDGTCTRPRNPRLRLR